MRGLFTAGVIDVWMTAGITFDGLVGVSAGACFGCNYKSRLPGRVIRYNQRLAKDPRYCSWRSLLKTGDLFNVDFCYREIPFELDPFDVAAYEANPMEFHLSVTVPVTGMLITGLSGSSQGIWTCFENSPGSMALSATDSVAADDGSIRIAESAASAPQQPFTWETLTGEDETLRSSMDFDAASPAAISPNATPSGGTASRGTAKAGNAPSNMLATKAKLTLALEVFI